MAETAEAEAEAERNLKALEAWMNHRMRLATIKGRWRYAKPER